MAGKLQQELHQTKAARSLAEEATLNIVRTADALMLALGTAMKPFNLSPTQYNVLRILRGAGDAGASCKDIATRLVARDPDITRLMDRLEQRGLIVRDRAKGDRRIVTHRLTNAGITLVNELDRPIDALNKQSLAAIDAGRVRQLIDVLEQVRANLQPLTT